MIDHSKTILVFSILIIQTGTYAQDYAPSVQQLSVQIDFDVVEHQWIDSSYYQFLALTVTGLPEVNTAYSTKTTDTIDIADVRSISGQDIFSGGYSFVTIISKNQTFNPVKVIKEVVYDPISKINKVKHTSLFLLDDFDKITKREALIIYSRGCFGYQTQSYADCNDFVADLKFDKSLLLSDSNYPIADNSWYQEWLKDAPEDYWNPRIANYLGEKHKHFKVLSERIKTVPNKK
jgi:hypothetical protein